MIGPAAKSHSRIRRRQFTAGGQLLNLSPQHRQPSCSFETAIQDRERALGLSIHLQDVTWRRLSSSLASQRREEPLDGVIRRFDVHAQARATRRPRRHRPNARNQRLL
jgi:hypothetical protein